MLAVDSAEERIAAVLHDVVEDTDWTFDRLRREGFPTRILEVLDALTRREDEDYLAFVRRSRINPIARTVKLADLTDNMDLSRLPSPSARDRARLEKYQAAVAVLKGEDTSGRLPPVAGGSARIDRGTGRNKVVLLDVRDDTEGSRRLQGR